MKENKNICRKRKFIDEVFGDEIEYAKIYDDNGITIIFGCDNRLIIKNFKNTKELIESYISMYNENEFTSIMFSDLDSFMKKVQDENYKLKQKLKNTVDKIICINNKNMEN